MEWFFEYINIIFFAISFIITCILYFVYRSTESRQLLNYTSNVWTSIGILGTFLCIVHTFSLELAKGEDIEWNVNLIVKNIIPAFQTSIIGIIGAIVVSIFIKILFAIEDNDEASAYDSAFSGKTPEEHLGLMYQQMSSLNDKNGTALKKLEVLLTVLGSRHNELLAEMKREHDEMLSESKEQQALATRMIENFTQTLKDFYDGLYAEEQQHMEEITNRYLAGIDNIIKSTHGTIKEKFEALFIEHSTAIKKLMENEDKHFGNLSETIVGNIDTASDNITTAISDMGDKQTKSLQEVADQTTAKFGEIADNTKGAVEQITIDNQKAIYELTSELERNIGRISAEFLTLVNTLKTEFETLAHELPDEITNIKREFISTIRSITEDKYNLLTEENKNFVAGLLKQVEDFEHNAANLSVQTQTQWLTAINTELSRLLNEVDENVKTNTDLLRDTTNGIGESLSNISTTLKEAADDYKTLSGLINNLVGSLQKETNATEVYANSIQSTNIQLQTIQNLLADVVNKNLQLRQELAQWKRTHKHIKVNTTTGEKECPNCHEWNPVEASYCKKCATSFWECKPLVINTKSNKEED